MLTFASPAFLWGLLGLAAPVLIHLINRDLFRPLFFPSIRFIMRGKMPVERKRRLRDLLLLCLRLLLFAAIVTALAHPQWQPRTPIAATGDEKEIVLLVDASASMSGWQSWPEVKLSVDEILSHNGNAPVGLVISAAGPVAIRGPSRDHDQIRRALASTEPATVAGDHREAFRQAVRLFSGTGARQLVVISDLQATDWSTTVLPRVPAGPDVEWHAISANRPRENAAILQARALPLTEGRRQVVAEIRNFGAAPIERNVRLRAGDETQNRPLQLGPGETGSAIFIIDDAAAARAEVSIEADAYPTDDRYHVWLGPPPALRVLAIAPLSEEPEKAEELFFLSKALQSRTQNQWLHFNVEPVDPGALQAGQLEGAHAILLLGAGPYLSTGQWSLIREYIGQGGRMIVTPGKAPARQTTLLGEHRILPLAFGGTVGVDRQRRPHGIEWLEPSSPLALLFRDEAARALSHVAIYRYARFQAQGEEIEHLMRTGSGDPILLERALGSGRIYATAFPFESSWTDLPLTTAFLPMIRELVAGDLPPDFGLVYAETGAYAGALSTRLGVSPDHSALAGVDTAVPGLHMIGGTPLILNVSRSESIPATVETIDLAAAITPPTAAPAAAGPPGAGDQRVALWPWFALAALLLFIIEMPLAARLRRAEKSRPAAPAPAPARETIGAS